MKRTGTFTVTLVLIFFLIVSAAFMRSNDLFFELKQQITIFNDTVREVTLHYIDETTPRSLVTRAIHSMLESLDPYTVFIDEGEQLQMEIFSSGGYGGIGLEAGYRGDQIVIIAPIEGYPAYRAGLRAGDIILRVNGVDVSGLNPEDVQRLTIGDIGSEMNLTIQRTGISEAMEFSLIRERIELKNIHHADRVGSDASIGYLHLSRFGQNAAEEVRQALIAMDAEKSLGGIVLDFRNNPGGLLNEAVELVDLFVEPGITVVETRGRNDAYNTLMASTRPPLFANLPLTVLINEGSASASEVVAGALQDLDRAVIVGQSSFGKGLVQSIRPLSYNTSLKITISRYYTPSGRSIQSDLSSANGESLAVDSNRVLRRYMTRNGREVLDGRGILPDLEIREQDATLLELALRHSNTYLMFVNRKLSETGFQDESGVPGTLFSEFVRYLIENEFTFETPADRLLEEMDQLIGNFPKESLARENINELKALLRDHKISQIYENQSIIEQNLAIEWISQTAGESESRRAKLNYDAVLKEAVVLLENRYRYQSYLIP
ncbi:MAG: S41 family peptidase [Balneolaceae bacterium]|nr:MAG: S41 family peptidase [Balneolaceae bacterium]